MARKIKFEYLQRPGLYWTQEQLKSNVSEFRELAQNCLDEIPDYQCLRYCKENLSRVVMVTARDAKTKKLLGICSSLLLDIPTKPNALHLGLTLVHTDARSLGLTHKLTSKLLMNYLVRNSLTRPIWVTNVACVISSLGNVALHFENVFPSPSNHAKPTVDQIEIAKVIDKNYRDDIYIDMKADFNPNTFIFEKSVLGTMWQKSASDTRYHHRKKKITEFYANYMDFERGDEVLQVGHFSLMTFPKYLVKKTIKKMKRFTPTEEIATKEA